MPSGGSIVINGSMVFDQRRPDVRRLRRDEGGVAFEMLTPLDVAGEHERSSERRLDGTVQGFFASAASRGLARMRYSLLTLEFASGQTVLRMNARSPSSAHRRPDKSGSGMISENHRITC